MTSKQKLLEKYPSTLIYYYHSLSLYGKTTKIYCVKIGDNKFTGDTEAKVAKEALTKLNP